MAYSTPSCKMDSEWPCKFYIYLPILANKKSGGWVMGRWGLDVNDWVKKYQLVDVWDNLCVNIMDMMYFLLIHLPREGTQLSFWYRCAARIWDPCKLNFLTKCSLVNWSLAHFGALELNSVLINLGFEA